MSNQICLKWNSFLNNIATSFESLWQEEGFVDVTLASDGQCLTAHKVILSASSPFFKKLFQKNPCQHPVIILQDVHFSELEALLFFIYKGEVNIEEKNLPALLKAAETLQIRGLSGADIFSKDLFQKTDEVEQILNDSDLFQNELNPKKKHKSMKTNPVFEKVLAPTSKSHVKTDTTSNNASSATTTATSAAMIVNELCSESNVPNDVLPNSTYQTLEMKVEPFEVNVEDLQTHSINEKDALQELDTGQRSGNSPVEEISTLSNLSSLTGLPEDVKPLLYSYQSLPYADLLPSPEIITTMASSRPIDHLACDLMKILFTPEERILCNVNGKMGKQQFDSNKIHLIQEVLLHYSGISSSSVEWEEAWKNCVTKIDTSNRGLKRYLFQRRSVYTQ